MYFFATVVKCHAAAFIAMYCPPSLDAGDPRKDVKKRI